MTSAVLYAQQVSGYPLHSGPTAESAVVPSHHISYVQYVDVPFCFFPHKRRHQHPDSLPSATLGILFTAHISRSQRPQAPPSHKHHNRLSFSHQHHFTHMSSAPASVSPSLLTRQTLSASLSATTCKPPNATSQQRAKPPIPIPCFVSLSHPNQAHKRNCTQT